MIICLSSVPSIKPDITALAVFSTLIDIYNHTIMTRSGIFFSAER